eukprot:576569-Amphidinium_carterae.1
MVENALVLELPGGIVFVGAYGDLILFLCIHLRCCPSRLSPCCTHPDAIARCPTLVVVNVLHIFQAALLGLSGWPVCPSCTRWSATQHARMCNVMSFSELRICRSPEAIIDHQLEVRM